MSLWARPKVALLIESSRSYGRELLKGVVCNDIRGQQVLNVCRLAGIDVPDNIGVVGVDDDEAICPLCDPPLSSVRPDAQGVGYRAAEILHELIGGVLADSRLELIPPKGVAGRLSTQVLATLDREVAQALRFIREHACEGIKVVDVSEHVSIFRRQLERRFRTELNHTIHEEITATQITMRAHAAARWQVQRRSGHRSLADI